MNPNTPATDASVQKVLEGVKDQELAGRYPTGTHLIAADHPQYGLMATRALFEGDPVVLVYPDGREILFTPEPTRGVLALLMFLALGWMLLRSRLRKEAEIIQFPPRTRIEARDSRGLPIAA
jgi:hypothetical protein